MNKKKLRYLYFYFWMRAIISANQTQIMVTFYDMWYKILLRYVNQTQIFDNQTQIWQSNSDFLPIKLRFLGIQIFSWMFNYIILFLISKNRIILNACSANFRYYWKKIKFMMDNVYIFYFNLYHIPSWKYYLVIIINY